MWTNEEYDRIELVPNTFGKVPCTQECPEDCSEHGAPWCRLTRAGLDLFPCGELHQCQNRFDHPDACDFCALNPRCEGSEDDARTAADTCYYCNGVGESCGEPCTRCDGTGKAVAPAPETEKIEDDGIPF